MKRVFAVHGWQGKANIGWRLSLREELQKKGWNVCLLQMPNPFFPKQMEWVDTLAEAVGAPDTDCYFVGHSLGCITVLRYLETISEEIGGAVFVAGFGNNVGINEVQNFFDTPIDWERIRTHCKKIVLIHSDNDSWVPLREGEFLKEKIRAELIIQRGMGHFSAEEGITQLPVVTESLLRMSR